MRSFHVVPVVVAVITATLFSSCARHPDVVDGPPPPFAISDSLLHSITVDTIRAQPVTTELTLTGKIAVNEDRVVTIMPLVTGRVTALRVTLGDYVVKGSVLAVLKSPDMAGYYGDVKSAQSELAIATKALDVARELQRGGIASERELLVAQQEYEKTLAQLNRAREVLRLYGNGLPPADSTGSMFVIRAPISGFIVDKHVAAGMDVRRDDATPLLTIGDLQEVWATANVFESDIATVNTGDSVDVTTLTYPDRRFTGTITRTGSILDPATNVLSVRVRLPNPGYVLKPGMYARMTVRLPERDSMLAVPSSAIVFEGNRHYVVRMRGQADVSIAEVRIAKSVNDLSFIECDSLRDGDAVIARNGLFVFTAIKKQ